MPNKRLKRLTKAQKINMSGILLDQALPNEDFDQVDPFLLIHHMGSLLPGGQKARETGIGAHPHRGFSPVTLIIKGAIRHRDSRGNDQVVEEGGTQWMHSGMGIVHSERPAPYLAEKGGELEIIQFWVNVPPAAKMKQPSYQPLTKENTPSGSDADGRIQWSLVAGQYQNKISPIHTESKLLILNVSMVNTGPFSLTVPEGWNTLLYIVDGQIRMEDTVMQSKMLAVLENDGTRISLEIDRPGRILLLSGEPIGAPVKKYGPFVMNTQTEIMTAIRDSQIGRMGILIEED